jgi:folate-binding Fe-S cluster repair protein YgfZ
VSFTKGCYLGQEIVARMQSLGAPKQKVVGIRLERAAGAMVPFDPALEPQPDTGAPVYAAVDGPVDRDALAEPIGQVTSSAVSPMLSGTVICFATVRSKSSAPGTRVLVEAEGRLLGGEIRGEMSFFKRAIEGANA